MEHIITFLPGQFSRPEIYRIQMAGITYPDGKYVIQRDRSPVHCLEFVLSGTGEIRLGGRTYHPGAGSAYLLPAGKNHFYRASAQAPWKKIWMNVQGTLCDSLVHSLQLEDTVVFPGSDTLPLFQEFLELCQEKEFSSSGEKRTQLILHEILWSLSQGNEEEPVRPDPARRIRSLLDSHIYHSLTMEELSREASLSPSQLTRVFKKAYGQTPYDYLLSQKLTTARLLLTSTTLPIKEISYRLHFADEHYFSNLFKAKTGCSPLEFRKRG